MRLSRRVRQWQDAGLMTPDQASDILTFEQGRLRDRLQAGFKYTGLLAIMMGIALIVAANWGVFGVYSRLGGHFIVNALIASMIWRWRADSSKQQWREGAVYMFCGLTLTLLALIGQSFHLQGNLGGLLALWMALITGVVVSFGQNRRIANFWMLGMTVTAFYTIPDILDQVSPLFAFFVSLSCVTLLPLALWCLGSWPRLSALNAAFGEMLRQSAISIAVIFTALSSFVFYEPIEPVTLNITHMIYSLSVIIFAVVTAGCFLLARVCGKDREMLILLGIGAAFTILTVLTPIESKVLGTLHFMTFAAVMAVLSFHGGHEKWMGVAFAAIALRAFSVFLEIFGTMLMTGWGLILVGLVLLGSLKIMHIIYHRLTITDGGTRNA